MELHIFLSDGVFSMTLLMLGIKILQDSADRLNCSHCLFTYWLVCVRERTQLVCVCVYVGTKLFVAPFLLFTQQPAFRHVSVFADWARQLTQWKKWSTCLCSTSIPSVSSLGTKTCPLDFRRPSQWPFEWFSHQKAKGRPNQLGVMLPSQFLPFIYCQPQ